MAIFLENEFFGEMVDVSGLKFGGDKILFLVAVEILFDLFLVWMTGI